MKIKERIVKKVASFMASCLQSQQPFLVGYSGGPDSKALLYLLLECQRSVGFELALVHIDHNWREESSNEARAIELEAKELCLPLYLRTLKQGSQLYPNQEAFARQERLQFFAEIYRELNAQGLLLAHQADDQAETVLKRLLEGAHPIYWKGMEAEAVIGGMRVLRPLLNMQKKELVAWIEGRELYFFTDASNRDSRFLRGRMRSEILPTLAEQFGKEISLNLCKLSSLSLEIHAYLMKKCEKHWGALKQNGTGIHWDLTGVDELLELKWLLKVWVRQQGWSLSYQVLNALSKGVLERRSHQQFPIRSGTIFVNCGILTFVKNN
jgi:tRNA(Ile)-lysidine synthase